MILLPTHSHFNTLVLTSFRPIQCSFSELFWVVLLEKEIDKMLDFASDRCSDVTDAYEHALFARFPRERYLVGFDAKYVFIPVQVLPEWLGDWILRVINPGPSLPVVGKKQKLEANNN